MTYLLVAFLVIILLPLFASSWRMSLLGLAAQGMLLGSLSMRTHGHHWSTSLITIADFILIRGMIAPRSLWRVLSSENAPRRNHVIAPNLFSWALVGAIVFVAFRFSTAILRTEFSGALHLAVATAALLLGMFVLSSQNSMFSQMIGVLRIENAIALFELFSPVHFPLPVRAALPALYGVTVFLFVRFLTAELQADRNPPTTDGEPTL